MWHARAAWYALRMRAALAAAPPPSARPPVLASHPCAHRASSTDPTLRPSDEIHTIVGAGKSEGAMDAGNLLKPMLARGELRCIGATTLDEYRQNIEKDPALER